MTDKNQNEMAEQELYIFPTSFAQQRLWFLDQFEPGSPFYNIPTAVRIKGTLDIAALQDTIDEIVYRHESLRTTFDKENNEPVQVIHPDMECPLEIIDLRSLEKEEREAEGQRLALNEARTPFDLQKGPLFRSRLIRLQDDEAIMLVTMHHIISDGWSIGVFMREVALIYDAFTRDQDVPLPELPIQYADFSKWQRDWLQGEVLEKQLNYWKETLGPVTPVLELPTDKPRPAIQSSRGANFHHRIPRELYEQIIALSRREGVTPFMSLLAVFNILLYRYSGQEDICVGTPIANRTQSETEGLIGFFVNTLVLRTDLSGNPTFSELLQRTRKRTLESYAHQDVPFEMLVEVLQPERSMSHSPLFQVMFILQNATGGAMGADNTAAVSSIQMEQIEVDAGTATFDITVSLADQTRGLLASVEYCTDLFEQETIERFIRQYENLLAAVAAHPQSRISDLSVLSEQERHLILKEWNRSAVHYNWQRCMHHLVEEQVRRQPAAVAVAIDGAHITYEQLNRRANQLARHLRSLGVGAEVPVGISLEKSPDLMVAVLAVLKAGGGYVPMDPDYPPERLAYMIEDSATPVLITHGSLVERLPQSAAKFICLDREQETLEQYEADNPDVPLNPQNMAYMIYTSGTTGQAKGTVISHQSWVNSYYAWEEAYELKTRCRSHLQMANFSFDVFAGDTIRALCSGGKLTLIPRETLLNAEKLYREMLREEVTIAEFVPAVLRNLTSYLDEIGKDLSFMRCLIAGSDAWYVGEYRRFLEYGGSATRLINSFGLTEAAIDSTYFEASKLDLPADRNVPIGRPFANMQIYIVDSHLNPQPIGVPGEICVGGAGVARGYHGRPALTAEKFIPDPFGEQAGARMYRTGDKGKFLPDGNIEFMGRIDFQVKLRGFRIELGEIESALARHPAIDHGVVIVREDSPGDKRLVAYYTLEQEPAPGLSALKSFLLEKLPDYMIPNAFVRLDKIPLTPNGKVDRKALPKPAEKDYGSGESYVAPRNETEEKMAAVWGEVLGLEKVGINSNFFDLGGHSLLATQLISRVREAFDLDIPLRSIFEYPTVAGLAEKIEITQRGTPTVQAPPIMAVSRSQELPLSFSQQRLWFLEELEPGTANYNIPESVRIKGKLDAALFQRCLNTIIARHENLRTNFISRDGHPALVIHKERTVELERFDLREMDEATREKEALRIADRFAKTIFNLSEGPLLRAGLVHMNEDDFILLVTIHHIISDDWSTQVFIRELGILYEAFLKGESSPLPPLPVQYADFAHWQQTWLSGEVLEEQLRFWQETLAGVAPVLELPTDRPRPKMPSQKGSYLTFAFTPGESAAINTFTRDHGLTPFMTLLAAFETLLYRYSGQESFNIGTPIANRNRAETEPLIGFFVNTLVLPVRLEGQPTFSALLEQIRETALDAFAHQDVPFEKIVDRLQPDRSMSHTPLFQVMFALQNAGKPARERAEDPDAAFRVEPVEAHSGMSKFDITLFMLEENGAWAGAFEYATDLFDADTMERMAGHFKRLTLQLIRQPHVPVDAVPFIDPPELDRLIREYNSTPAPQPPFDNVVRLLEHQADVSAEKTALEQDDARYSYRQFNEEINRLAHLLIKKGLGPEQRVGLCFQRSPEMIIALFAILKSGAAYVPIDPAYPAERITYMVHDANLALLLHHQPTAGVLEGLTVSVPRIEVTIGGDELAAESVENPRPSPEPQQLAYMIYTSGSTGKPKGTLITHAGLMHYLSWTAQGYPLGEGRGSLVHATLAFDATVTAVYTPLINGQTITLASAGNDLEALAGALLRYKDFNIVKITPAHLDLLAHQIPADQAASLTRAFVIGGENLSADQIAFWQQQAADTHLFNEYGPTETVVGCVVFDARGWQGQGSVPIGRSIPGTPVYVLDSRLQPVPHGVPGELYIGGAGVARGYHLRPALTAERFLPDPFGRPGSRMYKTGDIVRYLNNGQLIFLGRADDQVKVRGYRIELGEIEALLNEQEAVREAVAIVREDVPGDKRIVAYWVPADETAQTETIRQALARALPEYMQPSAYVALENIPLTPNGKVDRQALPAPELDRSALSRKYIAPETESEQKLAEIWEALLQVDQVGRLDNFFELGGHSLLATQLMARIREQFSLEAPLRLLFESPTLEGLAAQLDQLDQSGLTALPPLTALPREEPLPLSFAQQRLWFLDQLNPGSALYNIPAAFVLKGHLDHEALRRTLEAIVERHETLRSTFDSDQGKPFVVIHERLKPAVDFMDIREMEAAERLRRARQIAATEAVKPFDLHRGPLLRLTVVRLEEQSHLLMLNMHHIISDGWSTSVLMREVSILYRAFARGEEAPLPPLPLQYTDYAIWQRRWLVDEVLEQQLAYWKNKIGINPPPLQLPTDFARPAMQTFNGAVLDFSLDEKLTEAVKALALENNFTLYMVLMAAWNTLMYKYSGQETFFTGTPVANRRFRETEPLIGFFVNTLVMRADMDNRLTFMDVLRQVRQNSLEAQAHQDIPFEQLVDALVRDRDMSRSPLFQVMFVLQNTPVANMESDRLTIEAFESDEQISKFDLTLSMLEGDSTLKAQLEYNTDLFKAATARRLMEHFKLLLQQVTQNPAQPIGALSLMDAAALAGQARLLAGESRPFPDNHLIQQLFEQTAETFATKEALRYKHQSFTFADLNRAANRRAHQLRKAGLKAEQLVGISLERSPHMVIALLAVLKAGGVYVPIDPEYPDERIRYILEDAGIGMLLTTQKTMQRLKGVLREAGPDTILFLDEEIDGEFPETNPAPVNHPRNMAYMIYTSGSTGRPKGTMVEHRSLCNLTTFQIKDFLLNEHKRCLQFASFSFDASVSEIFTTLVSGATLVLADKEEMMPGPGLVKLMRDEHITTITLPPSVSALLNPEDFPELDTLVSAGEALPVEVANRWRSNNRRLINAYGPTENTVCATRFVLNRPAEQSTVPIGSPIDNVRVYVLDSRMHPQPFGVPGELYLAGDSLTRGYFKRPELTAERFVPEPFSGIPGARMYRTGDRVRLLDSGVLEFLGRMDEQLKLRGFRIEPGEIEHQLSHYPGIADAVIMVRNAGDQQQLAAYYVAPEKIDAAALRAHMAGRLPHYMQPAAYVHLQSFPLTPNGKVDKRALPEPQWTETDARRPYQAPRNDDEQKMTDIWCEVLKQEKISIHDNFFEIGGHSLLATQLVSRVRDRFETEVELRLLFEAPTISAFTALVLQSARQGGAGRSIPLVPVERDRRLPLSFAQQRLWFLDQLAPDQSFYNIPASIRHRGKLNIEAFKKTVEALIMRHEVLRTTFNVEEGQPYQHVHPRSITEVDVIDLSGLSEDIREEEARRLVNDEANEPFDLELGPLFRAKIVIIAPNDHLVLFTMHHIISDGWSVGILMREFTILYQSFERGRENPLPPLPLQYADYAVWQRSWLKDEVLQKQIDYWKRHIGLNPPALQLPLDFQRPAVQTFNGDSIPFTVEKETLEKLKAFGQREGVTLFMTLLAAFQTFLRHYSGQDEILVGSPIANRTRSETEALIGFFVNTLVFRADFDDRLTFRQLLTRTRRDTLDAYGHQDLPFEQLVEILQPERNMSHSPIFQVMFVLQNTPSGEVDMEDSRIRPIEAEQKIAKYDLSLIAMEAEHGLMVEFEYNTDLFREKTIRRMQERFAYLLDILAEKYDRPLLRLSLLPEKEREKVLALGRGEQHPAPGQPLIQHLFEETVLRYPHQTAVVFKDRSLTFRELNAQANRLAHLLRASGVGPEKLVAISVERSMEMVVGLLAVIKAGGVYVPVDPDYPLERIAYILKDANSPWLLTSRSLKDRFRDLDARLILLDEALPGTYGNKTENPIYLNQPDNLAYVIYTSGSTGRPKGTMLTHRGLCNLTLRQIEDFQLTPERRCLQFASFSFDASVSEIFTTLVSGAALYLMDRATQTSTTRLTNLMRDSRISTVTLPPSLLNIIKDEALPGLHTLISAGEALAPDLARHWSAKCRLLNAYGPTENTVCASRYEVRDADSRATIPIGTALGNVRLYVLDENMNLSPTGIPGELYLAGTNLARGYLNRPALTAERFLPDPFSGKPGARMYRTGDKVRWLESGHLEFLGRADSQLKVRGFRIEPGEIEARMRAHPAVKDAVLSLQHDDNGLSYLAAYVIWKEKADAAALKSALREQLPDYMIPAVFTGIEQIPLTPNGKVDYRALPEAAIRPEESGSEFIAPRNAMETRLAEIWETILGINPIGVRHNFFELGGHSLMAMQLLNAIEKQFKKDVTLIDFFKEPTIEHLAALLTEESKEESGVKLMLLAKGDTKKPAIFFVHPSGGAVHHYQELAGRLTTGLRFYGIQAQGLDGKTALHKTVEEMAEAYISALKEEQPEGPYILGSWSLGVIISYEMARQLRARGDEVSLLMQLDQGPFVEHKSPEDTAEMLTEMFKRYFKVDTAALRKLPEDEQFKVVLKKAKKVKVVPRFVRVADFQRYITVNETQIQAWLKYKHKPLPGAIHLFRSAENRDKEDLRWGELCDRVDIIDVPGDHIAMLQNPDVRELAAAMDRLLREKTG